MAFDESSRYYGLPTVEAAVGSDRTVTAVKLRRIPNVAGDAGALKASDRLDILAQGHFQNGAKFWHIADANTELDAKGLVERLADDEPRVIRIPRT